MKAKCLRPIQNISLALVLQVVLHVVGTTSSSPTPTPSQPKCQLRTESDIQKKLLKSLEPVLGQKFSPKFDEIREDGTKRTYTFFIGICTQPCPKYGHDYGCGESDGVVQTWTDEKGKPEKRIVGKFDNISIQGSDRWKMMTLYNGDEYHHHCVLNKKRKAHIMFTCDPTLDTPVPKVLEENNQSNDSCYYLFEFAGKDFCPPKDVDIFSSGVSAGSVIVILFALAVSCYLVFGCLYRRIVVGAKGMDQVPNLEFWQNVGNLMADGCDFAFRSKNPRNAISSQSSPGSGGGYQPVTSSPSERVYKGLGDEILANSESNDDSLLPM